MRERGTASILNAPTRSVYGQSGYDGYFDDSIEHLPELMWPVSLETYGRMRHDSQVSALMRGVKNPIGRLEWSIRPNGNEALARRIAEDLGLPIEGEHDVPGNRLSRVDWKYFLRHVLMMLDFGFMAHEIVAYTDGDYTGVEKLGERMPQTIKSIGIDRVGGLKGITQERTQVEMGQSPLINIPANRLVMTVWDKEGAAWSGRSILRSIYQPWKIKQEIWKFDPIRHERGAVGVPVGFGGPDMTPAEEQSLLDAAAAFRGGEDAGAFVPEGADLRLLSGTKSTGLIESLKYCDAAMAKAFLMMFIELGQTQTGSRALSETFVDFFADAQDGLADDIAASINQSLMARLAEWNDSDDVPLIVWRRRTNVAANSELVQMVQAGLITADEELEDWLRVREGLPVKADTAPEPAPDNDPEPGALARLFRRK